jgi:RNA polymerase sigma-70 factor (ECF subfamily)
MSRRAPATETRAHAAAFPSTQWTVVLQVGHGNALASRAALESLCQAYWSPLYAFARRYDPRLGAHDAEDLVQGFLARLIERGDLETVGPEKGRFRTYLLAGLSHFAIRQALRDKAAKRGGGQAGVALDTEEAEVSCGPDLRAGIGPEQAYDRQWARTALAHALEALRAEYRARDKETLFDILAPLLGGAEAGDYEDAAKRLCLTRGAVAVTVHRMRGRLRALLRAEVQRTVGSGVDAEAEMRGLLETLASG